MKHLIRILFAFLAMIGAATASDETFAKYAQFAARRSKVPSAQQAQAYFDLIDGLSYVGVWGQLDYLYAPAADNPADALINLVSPAYSPATLVGSPVFTPFQGFTGSAGNYINTGFDPTVGSPRYTQNSASFHIWVNSAVPPAGYDFIFGGGGNNSNIFLGLQGAPGVVSAINSPYVPATDGGGYNNPSATGLLSVVRTDSASATTFMAGAPIGVNGNASAPIPPGEPFTLLAGAGGVGTSQVSLAAAGGALSDTQVISFANLAARYMNAVAGSTPPAYPTYAFPIVGSRSNPLYDSNPSIARLPDGRQIVFWEHTVSGALMGGSSLQYEISSDGAVPGAVNTLGGPVAGHEIYEPYVTVVGEKIYVTYYNFSSNVLSSEFVVGQLSQDGISWAAPQTIALQEASFGPMLQNVNGALGQVLYGSTGVSISLSSNQGFPPAVSYHMLTNSSPVAGDVWTETSCVVAHSNGTLACMARNDNTTMPTRTGYWQFASTDNSWATFTAPTQIFDNTIAPHPGGHSLVQTPSGGLFLLGRFAMPGSASANYGTGWAYMPAGGAWSAVAPMLQVGTGAYVGHYGNFEYSGCYWDNKTANIVCAIGFGDDTEPSSAKGLIMLQRFVAK